MTKEVKSDRGGSYVIIEKADADYKQLEWNELIGCLKDIEKHGLISCSHLNLPNIKNDYRLKVYINPSFYDYLNEQEQNDFNNRHIVKNTKIAKQELHESKKANTISVIALIISVAALALSLISIILTL